MALKILVLVLAKVKFEISVSAQNFYIGASLVLIKYFSVALEESCDRQDEPLLAIFV